MDLVGFHGVSCDLFIFICIYIEVILLAFRWVQVMSHYIQVLSSVWLSSKATACIFPWFLQHSRALSFAFYCLKGWTKLHNVNVIFNQIGVFLGYIALHLHCPTLFSLSNSRMQNSEHDCVAKIIKNQGNMHAVALLLSQTELNTWM